MDCRRVTHVFLSGSWPLCFLGMVMDVALLYCVLLPWSSVLPRPTAGVAVNHVLKLCTKISRFSFVLCMSGILSQKRKNNQDKIQKPPQKLLINLWNTQLMLSNRIQSASAHLA